MNSVTLIRPDESINTSYAYPVLINNEHITDLENDSQNTFTVEENIAVIQAKNSWAASEKKIIDLKKKNHVKLQVKANTFYNRIIRYIGAAFPALAAVWIIADTPLLKYSAPLFGLVLLLYLIYTLTIDKDNWLLINEVET